MRIIHIEETDSTNEYIRRYLPGRENTIVTADRQTGGKGTKGRSFLSDPGGVYFSALTFFDRLPAEQAFRIMAHAAVAVCRTAEFAGAAPEIKWPNDVLAQGKKLSGILIENGLNGRYVDHAIVGIGLNVGNDVSALGGIAINLIEAAGRRFDPEEVRAALIENYMRPSGFEEYLSYVRFLGKTVRVTEGETVWEGVARRILGDGRLEIEADGATRALSAAEISLRF